MHPSPVKLPHQRLLLLLLLPGMSSASQGTSVTVAGPCAQPPEKPRGRRPPNYPTEQRNAIATVCKEKQKGIEEAIATWFDLCLQLATELSAKYSKPQSHFLVLMFSSAKTAMS